MRIRIPVKAFLSNKFNWLSMQPMISLYQAFINLIKFIKLFQNSSRKVRNRKISAGKNTSPFSNSTTFEIVLQKKLLYYLCGSFNCMLNLTSLHGFYIMRSTQFTGNTLEVMHGMALLHDLTAIRNA